MDATKEQPPVVWALCLAIAVLVSTGYSQDREWIVGLRGGLMAPQNGLIQGLHMVRYDSDGAPTSLDVSGFGNGGTVELYAGRFAPDGSGFILAAGGQFLVTTADLTLAPDGHREAYDHRLISFTPVTLSRVHRFRHPEAHAIPYLGLGVGLYFSNWRTQQDRTVNEVFTRTVYSAKFMSAGMHFVAGCHVSVYHDLLLEGQFRYSYIPSNVRTTHEESNTSVEYLGLNIGGTALQVGLAFKL